MLMVMQQKYRCQYLLSEKVVIDQHYLGYLCVSHNCYYHQLFILQVLEQKASRPVALLMRMLLDYSPELVQRLAALPEQERESIADDISTYGLCLESSQQPCLANTIYLIENA